MTVLYQVELVFIKKNRELEVQAASRSPQPTQTQTPKCQENVNTANAGSSGSLTIDPENASQLSVFSNNSVSILDGLLLEDEEGDKIAEIEEMDDAKLFDIVKDHSPNIITQVSKSSQLHDDCQEEATSNSNSNNVFAVLPQSPNVNKEFRRTANNNEGEIQPSHSVSLISKPNIMANLTSLPNVDGRENILQSAFADVNASSKGGKLSATVYKTKDQALDVRTSSKGASQSSSPVNVNKRVMIGTPDSKVDKTARKPSLLNAYSVDTTTSVTGKSTSKISDCGVEETMSKVNQSKCEPSFSLDAKTKNNVGAKVSDVDQIESKVTATPSYRPPCINKNSTVCPETPKFGDRNNTISSLVDAKTNGIGGITPSSGVRNCTVSNSMERTPSQHSSERVSASVDSDPESFKVIPLPQYEDYNSDAQFSPVFPHHRCHGISSERRILNHVISPTTKISSQDKLCLSAVAKSQCIVEPVVEAIPTKYGNSRNSGSSVSSQEKSRRSYPCQKSKRRRSEKDNVEVSLELPSTPSRRRLSTTKRMNTFNEIISSPQHVSSPDELCSPSKVGSRYDTMETEQCNAAPIVDVPNSENFANFVPIALSPSQSKSSSHQNRFKRKRTVEEGDNFSEKFSRLSDKRRVSRLSCDRARCDDTLNKCELSNLEINSEQDHCCAKEIRQDFSSNLPSKVANPEVKTLKNRQQKCSLTPPQKVKRCDDVECNIMPPIPLARIDVPMNASTNNVGTKEFLKHSQISRLQSVCGKSNNMCNVDEHVLDREEAKLSHDDIRVESSCFGDHDSKEISRAQNVREVLEHPCNSKIIDKDREEVGRDPDDCFIYDDKKKRASISQRDGKENKHGYDNVEITGDFHDLKEQLISEINVTPCHNEMRNEDDCFKKDARWHNKETSRLQSVGRERQYVRNNVDVVVVDGRRVKGKEKSSHSRSHFANEINIKGISRSQGVYNEKEHVYNNESNDEDVDHVNGNQMKRKKITQQPNNELLAEDMDSTEKRCAEEDKLSLYECDDNDCRMSRSHNINLGKESDHECEDEHALFKYNGCGEEEMLVVSDGRHSPIMDKSRLYSSQEDLGVALLRRLGE